MIEIEHLTIVQAWNELKGIDNEIDLLETLRITKKDIKSVKMKDILISSGRVNNNALLNAITSCDQWTEKLNALYISKCAYEKYILEEIERNKHNKIGIIIAFYKEHFTYKDKSGKEKKLNWDEIAKMTDYSNAQVRRFYDEYKGKTPKDNVFIKDEQK